MFQFLVSGVVGRFESEKIWVQTNLADSGLADIKELDESLYSAGSKEVVDVGTIEL